jgi:hypothetical protein
MEELNFSGQHTGMSNEKLNYPNSEENSAYSEKFMIGEQTPKLKTEYQWRRTANVSVCILFNIL